MEKWKWSADQWFVVRDSWDVSKLSFEKDKDYSFSWPQRNYKCSFCKKEFKSAQALGGHMNVHRRDRARMRLSSPSLMDSQNPNPNVTSSLSATKVLNYHKTACNDSSLSCVSNPSFLSYADKELHLGPNPAETFIRDQKVSRKQFDFSFNKVPLVDFLKSRDMMEICGGDKGKKKKGVMHEVASRKDTRMLKEGELVMLDLSMGCFVGDARGQDLDLDLDLELRLGYC